jgi:hypothetical protein
MYARPMFSRWHLDCSEINCVTHNTEVIIAVKAL